MPTFYEFFAGGGMARIGLGPLWTCEFANDISPMKADCYRKNFMDAGLHFACGDINEISAAQLPGFPDLVWGSFPCQDLSVAGSGSGLGGARSSLIWRLLDICNDLKQQYRGPKLIVLENVTGLLNSRNGQDFYDILFALREKGFVFGTLMMDAIHFLPQSRPRVFLVAVDGDQLDFDCRLATSEHRQPNAWTSNRLDALWRDAPRTLRDRWVWWNLPVPPRRRSSLADLIEHDAADWDPPAYTRRLLELMAPLHLKKVEIACSMSGGAVGTLYRRTRIVDGIRTQRVEVRFDGVSGCLRTPSGGSSRQRLLFASYNSVRSRLMTRREAARLMGIPDSYALPSGYNEAYELAGDGVAVPVVEWLSRHLLLPLLGETNRRFEGIELELLYA